jgi:uncharacterized repeat protein (TIGR02059 family)
MNDNTTPSFRCGCVICQGNSVDQNNIRSELAKYAEVSGANNKSSIASRGTAYEVQIDGTPTNGANPFIDSLVWGGRWQSSSSEKTTITYSFRSINNFTYAWDATSIAAVEQALKAWENVANVDFVATTSPASANCHFWLNTEMQLNGSSGRSEVPGYSTGQPLYTYFNREGPTWSTAGLTIGGSGFVIAIHEFGHLLGLAHPHDGGSIGDPFPGVSSSFGDYGDYDLNQGIFTTMSYNAGWLATYPDHVWYTESRYGYQATPMALDIEAIQLMYGANTSYKSENDTYLLPKENKTGTYWSCIWDTGGMDTVSNAGSSIGSQILLLDAGTAGLADAGGWVSFAKGIVGGYTIAKGVAIENAIGGKGNDLIFGNELNNSLVGGDGTDTVLGFFGEDTIDGGNGTDDLVAFPGDFVDYTVGWSGKNLLFTDAAGDKTTVRNCELFKFDDGIKTLSQVAPVRDSSPPQLQSADTNQSGSKIVLTYNETLGTTGPIANAFLIKVAGKPVLVSSVELSGSTVELMIPQTIKSAQVVEISYKAAKPDASVLNRAVQDTSGNDASSVVTVATNNSTVDGTPPQLQSVATNLARNKIILSYDESLGTTGPIAKTFAIKVAGKSVVASSVTVNGSTIELSLPITASPSTGISVSYKAPKPDTSLTNPAIQDLAGNDVISFSRVFTASAILFAAHDLTNSFEGPTVPQASGVVSADSTVRPIATNASEKIELVGISGLISGELAALVKVIN